MKRLINIRGAVATGKTTAVREFCQHYGFSVEEVDAKRIRFPVSVLDGRKIVVLGDYKNNKKVTGLDNLRNKEKKFLCKADIKEMIFEVNKIYNPEVIIYERMLSSLTFKGTKEIADYSAVFGYEYLGVQLFCSEKTREFLLYKRSGVLAKKKNFYGRGKIVDRATEMLNDNGYFVWRKNVENIDEKDMWRIVDEALRSS